MSKGADDAGGDGALGDAQAGDPRAQVDDHATTDIGAMPLMPYGPGGGVKIAWVPMRRQMT
jgi:hypothetical protein